MPIQTPQWTEYLSCPVCENGFELKIRLPISLGCGHTICKTCLSNLQRSQCPFDLCSINIPLDKLPVNTALVLLIDADASLEEYRDELNASNWIENNDNATENENESITCDKNGTTLVAETEEKNNYREAMGHLEKLAVFLRPSNNQQMSRPMQRKLVTLINCQPLEEEGRARAIRAARSLGERSVTELILQHQNPQQLSANLWAAVRTRGCQFLGPAMQEEVLKLVLLALEDGSALSRKVLVMFVVQKLEPSFPQASKTSIGHVVQLLYRASCFKVTKRDGDSSLMQLKEEFRTYETLRREHDAQIVQIATEAGLRIAPDQWSSLLYGDTTHKSHMQSIIDKLQTPQSFLQSVQELVIALQRTGDPGKLAALRTHLDLLSGLDPNTENASPSDWPLLKNSLHASEQVVAGLLTFIGQHSNTRRGGNNNVISNGGSPGNGCERVVSSLDIGSPSASGMGHHNSRYKTSMCRDLSLHGSCPRGKNCSFAHSAVEMDQFRNRNIRQCPSMENNIHDIQNGPHCGDGSASGSVGGLSPRENTPRLLTTHQQFNSTQIQMPTQSRQHNSTTPSNGSVGMVGVASHRMPSPAPSMRVPPLMTAVSPMTAPVAQVAPVPRGFDHTQTQSMSQIVPLVRYSTPTVPPPSNPSQTQQQNHSHRPPPQQNIMNPDAVVALSATGLPLPTIPTNYTGPPSAAHIVGHPQVGIPPQIQKVATKSLSALKSRKEEIIDSMHDIVGKEATDKISVRTEERAASSAQSTTNLTKAAAQSAHKTVQQVQRANHQNVQNIDTTLVVGQDYSLWTSRAFTPFVDEDKILKVDDSDTGSGDEMKSNDVSYSITHSVSDELIPFSDSPQISRFGPISRKGITSVRNKPSQSQAIIDDQAHATPVVSNSKHMSRPAPSLPTAFLHQTNGTFMALQPVAVGVNGEIGYIAVQQPNPDETLVSGPEMAMDHQNYMSNMFAPPIQSPTHSSAPMNRNNTIPAMTPGGAFSQNSNECAPSQEALRLESERMKQELEVLQKKISRLNTARMSTSSGGNAVMASNGAGYQCLSVGNTQTSNGPVVQTEMTQLTSELQLIENTIKDREREIIINRNTDMTDTANEGAANLEYGSYLAQGVISDTEDSGMSQSITTTARSGHVTRTNGNYFDPI